MAAAALEILKNNLTELNLGFALSTIDTFLHDESRKERPLLETLSDLLGHELTMRRQRAAKISMILKLKKSKVLLVKSLRSWAVWHSSSVEVCQ
jgi:hypothetical protein